MTTRFRYAKELEAEIASAENAASPSSASPDNTSAAENNDNCTLNSELCTFSQNSELYYPYRMIDKSMAGTDVAVLQAVLSARGYYTGALDGIFGDALDAAVRKFQMDHDLVVDGVCGPQTWREILKLS